MKIPGDGILVCSGISVDSHNGQKSKLYLMGSTQLYTATKSHSH